jgi:hypothetical protein
VRESAYRQQRVIVKRVSPLPVRCGIFLVCLALLSGCLWRPAGSVDDELPAIHGHIDAVRQFTIEYPAHWQLKTATPTSVTWAGNAAQATVTTVHGGLEEAQEWLILAHPALVVTARQQIPLPAGSARRLLGQSAHQVHLCYLVAKNGRAAIIEFSTTPEKFDRLRPIFEQMADSFRILE